MKLWDDLKGAIAGLKKIASSMPKPGELLDDEVAEEEAFDGPTLSQWVTFGAHRYRTRDEVLAVVFKNKSKGIVRVLVDNEGYICRFPGIDERAKAALPKKNIEPRIRFRTSFERRQDEQILMIWEVQPDGRYWEDQDGYGGTNDEEILLCTHIDENGRYAGPFQLYSIGSRQYFEEPNEK